MSTPSRSIRSVLMFVAVSCCATLGNAPPSRCVTACGLMAEGACTELQSLEAEWVVRMSAPMQETPARLCSALHGWRIKPHAYRPSDTVACAPHAWPLGSTSKCAVGYTHNEDTEWIEVPDTNWRANALPHELVHAVELRLSGHAGHCEWGKRGIKGALRAMTGYDDWTASDCGGD